MQLTKHSNVYINLEYLTGRLKFWEYSGASSNKVHMYGYMGACELENICLDNSSYD